MNWQVFLGLPESLPIWLVSVFAVMAIFAFVVLPCSAVLSYIERKVSADLQARVGPNRAGPFGFFQPVADLFKLLQKTQREDQTKEQWAERLWFGFHTMALYSTVAVLPLGSTLLLLDTEMTALLPFWATLVLALGTMMLGLNQSSVPGWFGGVRIASQALSGAFPAMVSLICAGLTCHTFRWSDLVNAQGFSPFHWNAFTQPFGFLAFLVFISSGLVIIGIPPLDGGASVQDIHGGVASHLFGRKLILFRLGRFYAFFLWALITAVLFMGGWSLPQGAPEAIGKELLPWIEFSVLLAKTLFVLVSVVLVARATPRLRSDQVTDFAWKVLSPLALVALSGSTLWLGWAMVRGGLNP